MDDYLDFGGIRDRKTIAVLDGYFKDRRFEVSDGDVVYKGFNFDHPADTAATDWEIWKFTWSGGDISRIEGPLKGSWDGRAALGWG